jgi:hypothetical protein
MKEPKFKTPAQIARDTEADKLCRIFEAKYQAYTTALSEFKLENSNWKDILTSERRNPETILGSLWKAYQDAKKDHSNLLFAEVNSYLESISRR